MSGSIGQKYSGRSAACGMAPNSASSAIPQIRAWPRLGQAHLRMHRAGIDGRMRLGRRVRFGLMMMAGVMPGGALQRCRRHFGWTGPQIRHGIGSELVHAAVGTKIVGMALMIVTPFSGRRIDGHAANGIFCHRLRGWACHRIKRLGYGRRLAIALGGGPVLTRSPRTMRAAFVIHGVPLPRLPP